MNNNLTSCTTCHGEIAKTAKTCPKCGAENKQKGGFSKIKIAVGCFIAILIIAAIAGGGKQGNITSSNDSTTHTNANGGGEKKAKIGEVVKFPDSEWTVIEARNIGNTLSSVLENKHTSGSFINVKFSVINKTNEEEQILETPQLVDSKGRKFKQMDDCALYLPEGANEMTLEQLPAGLSKTFYAIFEVPLDAAKLSFQARSLGFSPEYALIDIGL